MVKRSKIFFLVGPTAAGKTSVAYHLAGKINAEIISCDSMQIYKGMRIISSQPQVALKRKIPHHLVGFLSPQKEYDVSQYRRDALKKVNEVIKKGKVPLFVGGTGLYTSIVIDGIFMDAGKDEALRNKLYRQAKVKGSGVLYEKLKKVDLLAALKIHPNDTKRIVRALEVFESTGKQISQLQKESSGGLKKDYDINIFCLNPKRPLLRKRIEERVEAMFKEGIVREARELLRANLSRTASYAIGIREMQGHLAGEYDLEEAKQLIKRNTRLYAKRQLTWFRKDKRIKWITITGKDTPQAIAERLWKRYC